MSSILSLSNVTKFFNQASGIPLPVLDQITVDFKQSSSYALMGISGSGKSTLLSLLAVLDQPTSGSIQLQNQPLDQYRAQAPLFYYHTISILFQTAHLIPELTIMENCILAGLRAGISRADCLQRGKELLAAVKLEQKHASFPAHLSGGERQRVALVRALFGKPLFLLADEPTAHLDEYHREVILDLLCSYKKDYGMGLIVSCHDQKVAQRMEIQYTLQHGTLVPV